MEKTIKVIIQLIGSSQPLEYDTAINTYTKDTMFCVYLDNDQIHKFPVHKIFRVIEDYAYDGVEEGDIKEL